jgi:hypothetical protein
MAVPPKRNDEFQFGWSLNLRGVRSLATGEEHML